MKTFIENWQDVEFESSSSTTPEFRAFATQCRAAIVKEIKPEFILEEFNRGHFEVSGFLKHTSTGKYVYFSISDVRYSKSWLNTVLVRSAEDAKDYTGGINNTCDLKYLQRTALDIVNY